MSRFCQLSTDYQISNGGLLSRFPFGVNVPIFRRLGSCVFSRLRPFPLTVRPPLTASRVIPFRLPFRFRFRLRFRCTPGRHYPFTYAHLYLSSFHKRRGTLCHVASISVSCVSRVRFRFTFPRIVRHCPRLRLFRRLRYPLPFPLSRSLSVSVARSFHTSQT